jgi:hypothetical protein
MHRVKKLDLYGITSQLPQGYLGFQWGFTSLTADKRYNSQRQLGEIFPPLEFELNGQKQLSADLGLTGEGGSHNFLLSYGVTDHLNVYIQAPFNYMSVNISPKIATLDDEGNRVGETMAQFFGIQDRKNYNGSNLLYDTFPALGRPTPGSQFEGSWLIGDVNTGFSWNYFRSRLYSAGLVGRLFLPTGHIPDPNQNLFFGTGPEIQIGNGGWGVGFSQLYDLRVFQRGNFQITASTEFNASYFFKQLRPYPTNFVTPSAVAQQLDANAFPDLSNLEGDFEYTPGWGLLAYGQLDVAYGPIGIGVAYGTQYAQKPALSGDPQFLTMVEGLELVADSSAQIVRVGSRLSLLPLSIPAQISGSWEKIVGGHNVLVYRDNYSIQLSLILPAFLVFQ